MIKNIILVAFGGALGSVFRYLISYFFTKTTTNSFPWSTFTVNILGCLLIGILFGYIQKNNIQTETLKILAITGFCGGFTTFSAISLENFQLYQNNQFGLLILYTAASILIGFLAVFLGYKLNNI
jgi:fluoride exporter